MGHKNMKVTFWGVRGSHPQCQPAYEKVGGHTSCVTVEVDHHYIILDAGTGLIEAGHDILKQNLKKATLLLSHPHADHINGLGFFKPLHCLDFELKIISAQAAGSEDIRSTLGKIISPPYFPVPWEQIACQRTYVDLPQESEFSLHHLKVSTIGLDHPGGSTGYRLENDQTSLCYVTDTTHTPGRLNHDLIQFVRGADLLIYDAMFTEEEFAAKPTWGHSTWNESVVIAKAASVKKLALFHHHPEHDDLFMDQIEKEAQRQFEAAFVSRQGMSLVL